MQATSTHQHCDRSDTQRTWDHVRAVHAVQMQRWIVPPVGLGP